MSPLILLDYDGGNSILEPAAMRTALMPKELFRFLAKISLRSTRAYLGTLILMVCPVLSSSTSAQDDLFGGQLFGGATVEAGAAESDSDNGVSDNSEASPLTRQLRMQATLGNRQLAQSVSALSRTSRWSEVDRMLRGVDVEKISIDVKADMAAKIGATQYLRMNQQDAVSPEAKAVLASLAKAQMQQTKSPQRIAAAIKRLGSESDDDRAAAARILFAGGNAAIAAIADQLTLAKPITPVDKLLPVYARFGDGIYQPLDRYALYGDAARREKALIALGRLSTDAGNLAALTSIHAPDASSEERSIAASLLQRTYGEIPSPKQVAMALNQNLVQKRDAALLIDRDDQTATLWTLSAGSGKQAQTLRPIKTTQLNAAYRDAADAAARMKRLNRFTAEDQRSILAADLAYRVMIDPQWGTREQVDAMGDSFGFDVDEDLLLKTIDQSIKLRDDAAVLGLLRWIAVGPRLSSTVLLEQSGGQQTSLVRLATGATVARIRFEAAIVVSEIAANRPGLGNRNSIYAGSSQVAKTLSEMTSLTDQPLAILVETRREVIVSLEGLLADLGFQISVVPSVSCLLTEIDTGGDLRLVLAKTQLWDRPAIELVDGVRRTPRGRNVPIVLYGDDEVHIAENRWKAPTVLIPQPASTAAMDEVFAVTGRRGRLAELSALERREFARQARQWLGGRSN
jgi:hypothetical protein